MFYLVEAHFAFDKFPKNMELLSGSFSDFSRINTNGYDMFMQFK